MHFQYRLDGDRIKASLFDHDRNTHRGQNVFEQIVNASIHILYFSCNISTK